MDESSSVPTGRIVDRATGGSGRLSKGREAPIVRTMLGGIARGTEDIEVATGVTCPTILHPSQ